ncbi:MAG: flagellar basal body L-ring protein FlgH [Candidatus Abyssubacteria bacterium]|nr:flagellar basal body L-ring protein FlgH [Candidatus Abyssubacteria bacterium]
MTVRRNAGAGFVLLLMTLAVAVSVRQGTAWSDSIYNSAGRPLSLYSTTKSEYKMGDIITILIVESFAATNTTSTNTDKETELDMGFQGFDDIFGLTNILGKPLSTNPSFGINAENEFDGSGSSRRSSTITGTVTGQVTEILPTGNLRIEASQTTVINDEKNRVVFIGTVRPQDITPQNTILSTRISNAKIRYEGVGPLSTVQKRGVITEFLEFIWPF